TAVKEARALFGDLTGPADDRDEVALAATRPVEDGPEALVGVVHFRELGERTFETAIPVGNRRRVWRVRQLVLTPAKLFGKPVGLQLEASWCRLYPGTLRPNTVVEAD